MDPQPQIVAILKAIEERLTDLYDIQVSPSGRVQQAQNDTLRIYGDTAQLREVFSLMRDQQLALADATAILVGRFVEHDRKVAAQHADILNRLEALATGVGQAEIAAEAAEARAKLRIAEEERMAELALAEDRAKELLSIASMDAIGVVQKAVHRAQAEIAKAAATQQNVITDAADVAREKLSEEAND